MYQITDSTLTIKTIFVSKFRLVKTQDKPLFMSMVGCHGDLVTGKQSDVSQYWNH